MWHEEFTERAAGCIGVVLAAIEGEERRIGRGGWARAYVNEMQVAARMVWYTAQVVTRARKWSFGRASGEKPASRSSIIMLRS